MFSGVCFIMHVSLFCDLNSVVLLEINFGFFISVFKIVAQITIICFLGGWVTAT